MGETKLRGSHPSITGGEVRRRLLPLLLLAGLALTLAPIGLATAASSVPSPAPDGDAQALMALEQAELTAGDAFAGDFFGRLLALSGDTALVGAYYRSGGGHSYAGAAYVFTRSGTTWSQKAKLTVT